MNLKDFANLEQNFWDQLDSENLEKLTEDELWKIEAKTVAISNQIKHHRKERERKDEIKKLPGMEQAFREAIAECKDKIEHELKLADEHLANAEAWADEFGIPFYSKVSRVGQGYYPRSAREKYKDLIDKLNKHELEDYIGHSLSERSSDDFPKNVDGWRGWMESGFGC